MTPLGEVTDSMLKVLTGVAERRLVGLLSAGAEAVERNREVVHANA
ncbi:hypothetical protein [Gulosibacter sp. ACHW.36C]|uniref:Uncharacterized protein n=1 Tax=Gulosibacter sediminis TaxID=1729695 RepID=A0ABY4N1J0_9MICO|nr:hypothetical protein [Gulosibacter sediminis]UQN16152.1 hypothetical protein M3M28_02205 [Gulosibacter sediminis]